MSLQLSTKCFLLLTTPWNARDWLQMVCTITIGILNVTRTTRHLHVVSKTITVCQKIYMIWLLESSVNSSSSSPTQQYITPKVCFWNSRLCSLVLSERCYQTKFCLYTANQSSRLEIYMLPKVKHAFCSFVDTWITIHTQWDRKPIAFHINGFVWKRSFTIGILIIKIQQKYVIYLFQISNFDKSKNDETA